MKKMLPKLTFKYLFLITLLQLICLSQECGGRKSPRRDANLDSDKLLFDPDESVKLPGGGSRSQVTCTGDCDADAYKIIVCDGNFRTKDYKCVLEDVVPGYSLEEYEVTCFENFPIRNENCYIEINLKKTPLSWIFEEKNQVNDPSKPGTLVSQVQCIGDFCKEVTNKRVNCTGIFGKLDYKCIILNEIPRKYKLTDYSIMCKNFRVETNDDCYVVIKIGEKNSAELDPSGERIKKILFGVVGFLTGVLFFGILFYFISK